MPAARAPGRLRVAAWCGQAEPRAGCLDQLGAAPEAVVLLLRQPLAQHLVERGQAGQDRGLLLHVRPHRLGLVGTPERRLARKALVEHAGERVAVGAAVHRLPADLLGRQVVERAHQASRVRRLATDLLGDTEVGQVGVILLADQHVGRLHVAVHQPAPVRRVQPARHLAQDAHGALRGQPAVALEQELQVAPLHEPHRQVELPAVLARLVDRDHVGMVERSGQPWLP